MKAIFRNFIHVLRRFKTSSILNILGLSVAFTVFTILMMQVNYDFGYNRDFERADDISILTLKAEGVNDNITLLPGTWASEIADQIPQIRSYALLCPINSGYKYNEVEYENLERFGVGKGFKEMFQPEVIEGSFDFEGGAASEVAISESFARMLFGSESAIDKIIVNYFTHTEYVVKAVIKDFPSNSSIQNGMFSHLTEQEIVGRTSFIFFQIDKKDYQIVYETLSAINYFTDDRLEHFMEISGNIQPEFIPFTDIYFSNTNLGMGNPGTTLSLLAIAVAIIVIAYINYINFSIAMAPIRLRALNIQRILGASKWSQRMVIVVESVLFSLLAFVLGLVFVHIIGTSSLRQLLMADISLSQHEFFLFILGVFAVILGIFFGLYPAQYITSFKAIDAIKGNVSVLIVNLKLRDLLITFQFVAAIVLIVVAIFINRQHNYVTNYDWGVDTENVFIFTMIGKKFDPKPLGNELLKDPRIVEYTNTAGILGGIKNTFNLQWEEKSIQTAIWTVDRNTLDFFKIPMFAGKKFSDLSETSGKKLIVNETFLKQYGFMPSDLIGKYMPYFGEELEVIGIAKDINFEDLKVPIRPLIYAYDASDWHFYVKLSGTDIPGAIDYINHCWKKFSERTINVQPLYESANKNLYRAEANLSDLLTISSFITILIAIMGVYGLITFNSKYRAKEIAIRKVQGSTISQIMLLLNKGILTQFVFSFIIAVPLTYYIVNKWLEQFAYKTPVYWWVFVLGALIVLLITILTVSVQSYRAATANPIGSLKNE